MQGERALKQEDVWRPNQAPLGLPPSLTVPGGCSRNKHPLTSPPLLFALPHSRLVPSLATPAPHCPGAPHHP